MIKFPLHNDFFSEMKNLNKLIIDRKTEKYDLTREQVKEAQNKRQQVLVAEREAANLVRDLKTNLVAENIEVLSKGQDLSRLINIDRTDEEEAVGVYNTLSSYMKELVAHCTRRECLIRAAAVQKVLTALCSKFSFTVWGHEYNQDRTLSSGVMWDIDACTEPIVVNPPKDGKKRASRNVSLMHILI